MNSIRSRFKKAFYFKNLLKEIPLRKCQSVSLIHLLGNSYGFY